MAFLDSDQGGPAVSRGNAVAAVASELNIQLTHIHAAPSADAAREATKVLLDGPKDIDGLFAFNDLMAAGSLKALWDLGRAVPEDCAVIGIDGIPLGELVTPELTTLALGLRTVRRAAVGLLDGLLAGAVEPDNTDARLTLQHQLVVRQSA
ncbi:substrate-binding domain-containing protein [Pseudarthrobacter sp. NamE2]|uniref:substrate-binding domain-containing protein n=1 Tax=Pseudarthrobacter sp. NamE2 TaxID=2576838 RepID=UPI001F0F01D7|nr:substrate-binding domain-containing protein [Pseudarthrobacter sp. NamE2]